MHIHTQEYYSPIKMNENLLFAFSSRSSQPRNRTRVSCIAGGFFTCWITRESECEVAQSCLTLWDPMDCSLPGSSVHGIFQAMYWSGLPLPGKPMKKEWKFAICDNMDGPGEYYAQGKKTEKYKNCVLSHIWKIKQTNTTK